MVESPVRVRFAPSPSGELHLGGARTALFNYLFSKQNNGNFFLRIEDTDQKRSDKIYIDQIIESLNWFGIRWDEPVIFQSKKFNDYRTYVDILVKKEFAYPCFCSKKTLQKEKDKGNFLYSRTCRNLSDSEVKSRFNQGGSFVYRFKTPAGKTVFTDIIYGHNETDNDEIGDFIILRSDGSPTYNLCAVVDDHLLAITHVIRGEDHLSNTPKQILIYNALKLKQPTLAHLPMILGSDKKRLSKRFGAKGIQNFKNDGYLNITLMNYLAMLGWNPGNEKEIFSLNDLINDFDLKKVQKKSAVWDSQKLNWISNQHISLMTSNKILENVRLLYPKWGTNKDAAFNIKVIDILKPRINNFKDFISQAQPFYNDPKIYDENDKLKAWSDLSVNTIISDLRSTLSQVYDWNEDLIENQIKNFSKEKNIPLKKIIMPLRYLIFGNLKGPSLFTSIALIGRKTIINRINLALKTFKF